MRVARTALSTYCITLMQARSHGASYPDLKFSLQVFLMRNIFTPSFRHAVLIVQPRWSPRGACPPCCHVMRAACDSGTQV